MKTKAGTEAVLSPDEVHRILEVCSPEGTLVGGQALGFWADHFDVPRPPDLIAAVSADVDFIGGSALAERLAKVLGWTPWIPSLDDATSQSGKVTFTLRDGSIKQVDFLYSVVGLATTDVIRRAIEMRVPEIGRVRVMHPVDVLDSRIQNILLLAEKRTPAGIAQAHLATSVVHAFIRQEIQSGGERAGLNLLERIARIAEGACAIRIFCMYGVDPLAAVPIEDFRTTTALHTKRWPQILAQVTNAREKEQARLARAKKPTARKKR